MGPSSTSRKAWSKMLGWPVPVAAHRLVFGGASGSPSHSLQNYSVSETLNQCWNPQSGASTLFAIASWVDPWRRSPIGKRRPPWSPSWPSSTSAEESSSS
jgi:hypothetical protein